MKPTMVSAVWRGSSLPVVLALNARELIGEADWAVHMANVRATIAGDPTLRTVR